MVSLGSLQDLKQNEKGKKLYRIEMGKVDIVGYEDEKFDEHFLYVETVCESEAEKILIIKGMVTKKVIFNKRPTPNLDRIGDEKPKQEGYSMFRQRRP